MPACPSWSKRSWRVLHRGGMLVRQVADAFRKFTGLEPHITHMLEGDSPPSAACG